MDLADAQQGSGVAVVTGGTLTVTGTDRYQKIFISSGFTEKIISFAAHSYFYIRYSLHLRHLLAAFGCFMRAHLIFFLYEQIFRFPFSSFIT